MQKVVTTDGNNNIKTSFAPGDAIHYRVRVNNTNSTKVTATFMFLATGPQQIFSWSGTKSVASGTLAITMASSVPVNALKGTYTLTVTVTYNGLSSTKSNSFTVKPTLQADYSQIWSGYVAEGNSYTDVKGSWTVPTAKCSLGETSRAAIWVGIGGIGGDNYLEQIGTSADCNIGIPHYWAWYEMFPADPVPINCGNGLQANDQISLAEVMNLGGGSFSLSIDTPECSFEITQTSQGAELNSAEWIVEDPPYSGCTPQCLLTHFVTGTKPLVNFSSCSANGNPITANPLLGSFTMTDDGTANGVLKAFPLHTTSGDTAFSVKWVQS